MPWWTLKSRLLIFVMQIQPRFLKLWCFLYFMNEKFNKNAKVEKLTKKVGRGVRLIVIGPLSNMLYQKSVQSNIPQYFDNKESPCISYSYTSSVATKNKSAANWLPKSFSESLTLFLLWRWVSLCSMWPYSDRWSQYRTKWQTRRSFTQGTEIWRTCLIFMAPELRHYHGCMRSVRQTVGEKRGSRTRHSFWVD